MDENELILNAQKGDIYAFEQLIKSYQQKIYNFALYKTKDIHIAEDVAQEVILRIFKKIRQYKFKGSFEGWMYRLTYNIITDVLKKFKHFLSLDDFETTLSSEEHISTEKNIQNEFYQEKLKFLINKIPHKFQFVLILFHIEEKSYQEIAEILQISEGTVKSRLFRARKILKKLLKKEKLL